MIRGLVNNDFEPLKKLTDRPSDEMDPQTEWTGMDWPLTVDGQEVSLTITLGNDKIELHLSFPMFLG